MSFGFTLLQKVWETHLVTFSHIADLIQIYFGIVLLLSCNLNYYMLILQGTPVHDRVTLLKDFFLCDS